MEKLPDEYVNQICMHMRVIDLMKGNPDIVNQSPEMKKGLEDLCVLVAKMMELLTDEQRDQVLEEHKRQLDYMEKKGKKSSKAKKLNQN
jgi:hypothetical protein